MSVVAVVPARGGSKGVPGKNLKRVGGRSLVARAVDAALAATTIDRVLVSTDAAEIAAGARSAGAEVVDRPAEIAGDTASSEAAVLHALASLDEQPEVVVFIQATSPFIDSADLDSAVRRVLTGQEDVVFSATETFAFLWQRTADGAVGVNHDAAVRPRRQDREAHFQETGAFYVMRTEGFVRGGHRFFGRVGIQEVDPLRGLEIDSEHELELARLIAPVFASTASIDVDAVITDFDGVHTDDRATVDSVGNETVTVSRADGAGVEALRRAGVPVLILSRETNPVVAARGRKLGVEVLQGVEDKAGALSLWAETAGVSLARSAYLGNDLMDLPAMALVGWPIAVADAHPQALAAARIVLERTGGHGAVRELAELILGGREDKSLFTSGAQSDRRRSVQSWQLQLAE
ncbi:MAG TPA: acylneuraminate cytidylyltransferase [Galbitalea sp.]|nr:acylneuraminate cytidylyltransferase [Galbitalea sp.]